MSDVYNIWRTVNKISAFTSTRQTGYFIFFALAAEPHEFMIRYDYACTTILSILTSNTVQITKQDRSLGTRLDQYITH